MLEIMGAMLLEETRTEIGGKNEENSTQNEKNVVLFSVSCAQQKRIGAFYFIWITIIAQIGMNTHFVVFAHNVCVK